MSDDDERRPAPGGPSEGARQELRSKLAGRPAKLRKSDRTDPGVEAMKPTDESEARPRLLPSEADTDRAVYLERLEDLRLGRPLVPNAARIARLRLEVPAGTPGFELLDRLVAAVQEEVESGSAIQTALAATNVDNDAETTRLLARSAVTARHHERSSMPLPVEAERWLFPGAESRRTVPVDAVLAALRVHFATRWQAKVTDRIRAGLDSFERAGPKAGEPWAAIRNNVHKIAAIGREELKQIHPQAEIALGLDDLLETVDELHTLGSDLSLRLTGAREEAVGKQAVAFRREFGLILDEARGNEEVGRCSPEIWTQLDAYVGHLNVRSHLKGLFETLAQVNGYLHPNDWNGHIEALRKSLLAEAQASRSLTAEFERAKSLPRARPLARDDWFSNAYRRRFEEACDERIRTIVEYAGRCEALAPGLSALRTTGASALPAWREWVTQSRRSVASLCSEAQLDPSEGSAAVERTTQAIERAEAQQQLPPSLHDLSYIPLSVAIQILERDRPPLGERLRRLVDALQPSASPADLSRASNDLGFESIAVAAYLFVSYGGNVTAQVVGHILSAIERPSGLEISRLVFRLLGDEGPEWIRLWDAHACLERLQKQISSPNVHPLSPAPAGTSLSGLYAEVLGVSVPDLAATAPQIHQAAARAATNRLGRIRESLSANLEIRMACRAALSPDEIGQVPKPWQLRSDWSVIDDGWAVLPGAVNEWLGLLPELAARHRRVSRGDQENALLSLTALRHVRPIIADSPDLVAESVASIQRLFAGLVRSAPSHAVDEARDTIQRWLTFHGAWLVAVELTGPVESTTRKVADQLLRQVTGDGGSCQLGEIVPREARLLSSLDDWRWLCRRDLDKVDAHLAAGIRAVEPHLAALRSALAPLAVPGAADRPPAVRASELLEMSRQSAEFAQRAVSHPSVARPIAAYGHVLEGILGLHRSAATLDPELTSAFRARASQVIELHRDDVKELGVYLRALGRLLEDKHVHYLAGHVARFTRES